jgi:hypothetical protein
MNGMFPTLVRLQLCVLVLAYVAGCKPRDKIADAADTIGRDESAFKLMIVLDLSGSFQGLMVDNGHAWRFTMYCVDEYFKSRIGNEHDEIIIAQISGERRSLLWKGTPRRLREEFSSAAKFRDFLRRSASPNGSLVHAGSAHAVKYMTSQKAVQDGKAKSAVLILSDFLDNGPNPETTEQQAMDEFTKYIDMGGQLGLYYVDQDRYFHWREKFNAAGYDMVPVEVDIQGRPPLPKFEQ